jgi:hypothetical protein
VIREKEMRELVPVMPNGVSEAGRSSENRALRTSLQVKIRPMAVLGGSEVYQAVPMDFALTVYSLDEPTVSDWNPP